MKIFLYIGPCVRNICESVTSMIDKWLIGVYCASANCPDDIQTLCPEDHAILQSPGDVNYVWCIVSAKGQESSGVGGVC